MRRFLSILLAGLLLLGLSACKSEAKPADAPAATGEGSEATQATEAAEAAAIPSVKTLPTVLDTMEYTLYTNIFYNQTGGSYVGQTMTKEGTFATIRDSFNRRTRYYVWGYNDQTKCCDWQWEFVPQDEAELPANGSYVRMTGTFAGSEDALDGYWFTDAAVETLKIYDGPKCDIDMGTMSATLERVQLINMQVYSQDYEGQIVRVYGRVAGPASVEHPYYDGAWSQDFQTAGEVPAIGKLVTVTGVWQSNVIAGARVELTDEY